MLPIMRTFFYLAIAAAVVITLAIVLAAALVLAGVLDFYPERKSLWDLLDLLLIPLSLALIAIFLQLFERRTDRRIAEERTAADRQIARERVEAETLQSYLDSMGTLINSGGLDNNATIRAMKARTSVTMRNLTSALNRDLIAFLRESFLLGKGVETSEEDNNDVVEPLAALLEGSNLSGANLSEAILRGADLSEANLSEAILRGADLGEAILRVADLRGADLFRAYLSGADLSSADLREADLREADLSEAILRGADLSEANLSGADLSDANLRVANLLGATLSGADLIGADLSGANLLGANLLGATLFHAKLLRATLSRANLRGANLGDADLSDARNWTPQQLALARTLVGATLPDGTMIETEEQEQAFKKEHGWVGRSS